MALWACGGRVDWRPVSLALALLLGGCLGASSNGPAKNDSFAQPTDGPITVPGWDNLTPTQQPPNLNDSGYLMDAPWHVGDEWEWMSNTSNYTIRKVIREEVLNGVKKFVVDELSGRQLNSPRTHAIRYYDAKTLALENVTYLTGTFSADFKPGDPALRYLRNGSFSYEETQYERSSTTGTYSVRVNSLFVKYETIPLLWGKVTPGRVEHRMVKIDAEGNAERSLAILWPLREYGVDAQYEMPWTELYRLTYVNYNGLVRGERIIW